MTRSMPMRVKLLVGAIAGLLSCAYAGTAFAEIDATAAKKFARKNSCLRCHAVDRKKEGPSYQSVAFKYKEKPEAQATLVEHLTTGKKVKLSDGHEENHKITKSKDQEQVKNLVAWILAQ